MALSSSDRKSISKKYVNIPDENISFQANIDNLEDLITEFQNLDASYKTLFDEANELVDFYHPEIDELEGQVRTSIIEQDIINSAEKIVGNFFFPNDDANPTPFLSDGIWKELKTYAKNKVVGKTYSEAYTTQTSESDYMAAVSALTASIFADYSQTERQTGTPDMPPPPPFNLATDLAALVTAVNDWESSLTAQETALLANTDSQQTTEIATALADVQNALAEIASWEALADYAVGGKVDDSGLAILNDEIAARTAFIPTRIGEIDSRLGDVSQNADGTIASQSGLYSARYVPLDLRLNLAEGSLSKQKGLELAKRVQQENIANNNDTLQYFTDNVLVASKLSEDATGTNTITVEDGSLFSVSDSVYIVSETVAEVSATITDINSNTITLDTIIPSTFITGDLARLLKEV